MALILRFSLISVAFGAHCVKVVEDVVEDVPKLSATEM